MKETITKVKRQPSEWEKIIANEATDKELIFKIYRQLMNLNSRKINNPIKKWTKELSRHFSKEGIQMANTWKDVQHHSSSEKCKTKSQWGIISLQSEWLLSKKSTNNKCWWGCGEIHCWWECKLVHPLWRTVWRFIKKLEIELPYDPAIPLLGTHTTETRTERDTCTPTFITALFTIAWIWKQP